MAIIIEEEKRKFNWFNLALVVLVVVIIGAVIYYLFFSPTPFAEKIAPAQLQSIQQVSSIKLQPEAVVNNPYFQILKQYVNPTEIQANLVGKSNPFAR